MSQSQTELMDARYGSNRNRRRDRAFGIFVAGAAILGFGGWSIGYAVWQASSVTGTVIAYKVIDENSAKVSLQVVRATQAAVECDVRALAADFGVVGFKTVTFAAGQEDSPTLTDITVRTTHRAVSADVKNCRLK